MINLQEAFNISLGLSKADRLNLGESAMTHAMVISGVHIDPITNKPVRYKVENSWGEDPGNKGWFLMTDEWFDQYVFMQLSSRSEHASANNVSHPVDLSTRLLCPRRWHQRSSSKSLRAARRLSCQLGTQWYVSFLVSRS